MGEAQVGPPSDRCRPAVRGKSGLNNLNEHPGAQGGHLAHWLRTGDWTRLQQHFDRHAPTVAEDYAARGLLRLRAGPRQGSDALADLKQAAALEPRNLFHLANLAQALIDLGQADEGLQAAEQALRQADAFVPALEKRCLALMACSHWDEAHDAFTSLARQADLQRITLSPRMQATGAVLASRWWRPIAVGGAVLRLPCDDDHDAIARWLADAAFMARYHRFEPVAGRAARNYIARAQRPPTETRRREWIIQDRHGEPAGFAAVVDIDLGHRRGELLIGLPAADAASALALKASIGAMAFAFGALRLDKLVSHVYGDNPNAQANTLHLGFREEGRLRNHLRFGDQPIDLVVNGLLAHEHAGSTSLRRLRDRWLTADVIGALHRQH